MLQHVSTLFIFVNKIIFHIWIYHILFFCLSDDEYLGWFFILAIMNNASVHFLIHIFVETLVFNFLDVFLGVELRGGVMW